jgi:hypothetical protein
MENEPKIGDVVAFTKRNKQYKGIIRKVFVLLYEIELPNKKKVRMPKKMVSNSQLKINLFE